MPSVLSVSSVPCECNESRFLKFRFQRTTRNESRFLKFRFQMFDTREPVRKNEVQTSRADRLDGEKLKYEYFIIRYFICLRERDHTPNSDGDGKSANF